MTTDTAPSGKFFAITPDVRFESCRAIYVGGGGDIELVGMDNSQVIFVGVPGGCILPVRGKRVGAAGTTATSLIGLR